MKKKDVLKEEPVISQGCLAELLQFLFCPLLEEQDQEVCAFAKAIVSRARKLDQDPDQCRKFYKKLLKKDGVRKEVEVADFRTLANRIR